MKGGVGEEEGPVDVHATLLQHLNTLTVALVTTGNHVEQLNQQENTNSKQKSGSIKSLFLIPPLIQPANQSNPD